MEFVPRVSKLAGEIAFLREKKQSPDLLAQLFDIDKGHIAVLSCRGKKSDARPLPSSRLRDSVWFNLPEHFPEGNPCDLQPLGDEIEDVFRKSSQTYLFFEGIKDLKGLLQQIGSIADPARRRLLARIYHHIAWFYLHSGYDTSAYQYAAWSMELSRQSSKLELRRFKSLPSSTREIDGLLTGNIDLYRYAETSRIKSLALRKLGFPLDAWNALNQAHSALETAKLDKEEGSEYYRQRGALLLKEDVDRARKYFADAMVAMKRKNEHRSEAHLRMVGTRNLNVVDQNCDEALDLTADIERTFGTGSLEHVLNAHYAAACCFCTDSPKMNSDVGPEAVRNVKFYAKRYGNQATISKLLEMTPTLKLSHPDRIIWVMRVLETNAFTGK
jgi:tetratricopeptide (TPR) repeat protein